MCCNIMLLAAATIAQWAKLANLGSVLISVKNIFIKSQKYFGSFIIYFLKNILVKLNHYAVLKVQMQISFNLKD